MRRKPEDPEIASRRARFVVSAVDQFADEMPSVFRRLGELSVPSFAFVNGAALGCARRPG
jgi:enoyl-CoA hydratase/carnithine racemase